MEEELRDGLDPNEKTPQWIDAADAVKGASSDQLQTMLAAAIGYKKMPPTIREFVTKDYYLGEQCRLLYPYWLPVLEQIFPTAITTDKPFVVFSGALGIGKSTVAKIILSYIICRLDHLKNPKDSLGIMPGKDIVIALHAPTIGLAESEFLDPMMEWFKASPYFSKGMIHGNLDELGINFVTDRGKGMTAKYIGTDMIGVNLSEINFIKPEIAKNRIDSAYNRLTSRFDRVLAYQGIMMIDSSAKEDNSIVDEFIRTNPLGDRLIIIRPSRWEAKKHMGYGRYGWRKVYCGDSTHSAFIVSKTKPLTPDLDPDRIIDVPLEPEIWSSFEMNLELALQDIAGVSTTLSDRFIADPQVIVDALDQPSLTEDKIVIDFDDVSAKLIYPLAKAIESIPKNKIIYIRLDIGVVGDNTGLAIGYFDGYKKFGTVNMPIIKVPVACSISRMQGQETSITHLEQLIVELSKRFEIGMVTLDQYGSRQLLQDLDRFNIKNDMTSVVRNDSAFVTAKNLMLARCLHIQNNGLLLKEFNSLRRIGDKVVSGRPEDGSHSDIAEAVVGMVQSLYDDIDNAVMLSNVDRMKNAADATKTRANGSSNQYQNMLNSLYGRK